MRATEYHYPGAELELFRECANWKAYWSALLAPYIAGSVLEVGAGLGVNTRLLQNARCTEWLCIEPDADLADRLGVAVGSLPNTSVLRSTVASLPPTRRFDAILYIDVLEHIEQDRDELATAASFLNSRGKLIVLAPAHQLLFSPFDASIGHFRRYSASRLRSIGPPSCRLVSWKYLDSLGLLLSLGNRLVLRQAMPRPSQLRFWDSFVVPASKLLDRVIRFRLGKTVVAVWEPR